MAITSTPEQIAAALQKAGQYSGSQNVWTPENVKDVGMDPEQGNIVPAAAAPEAKAPILGDWFKNQLGPEQPLTTSASTLGKLRPTWTPPDPVIKEPDAKAKEWTPPDPVIKEKDQPTTEKKWQAPDPVINEKPEAQQSQLPSQFQTPSQPAQTPPQPSPVSYPPIAEDQGDDPHDRIATLISQGKTAGEAKAIVEGREPKTLAGKTPAPVDKSSTASGDIPGDTDAQPPAPTPAAPSPKSQVTTSGVTPKAAAFNTHTGQWDIVMPDGTTQHLPLEAYSGVGPLPGATAASSTAAGAPSAPSGTTTDQPKTIQGGNIKGTATFFGLNPDGSIDREDNGIGFFGGINTRNPKLKAVAVPVDVLEATFGRFTKRGPGGTYLPLDTPEAKKIIAEIRSAHVEALGLDGKVHKFPMVDIQGSLKGHPGKVLDLTLAAGRELGFNDNHDVSYQIVGGDGKPYAIDPDQLAGWNKGGESGKGEKGGSPEARANPLAGQPLFSIGSAGGGGGTQSAQPLRPSFSEGGVGGETYEGGRQSNAGSIGLGGLVAGALAGAAASGGEQKPKAKAAPEDEEEDPMIAALMKRGFTQPQAVQFAQSSQTIAPGKGVPALKPPGPVPTTPSQLPGPSGVTLNLKQPVTPKLVSSKQLMPGKVPKIVPGKPPPGAPGKPLQLTGPSAQQQPQAQPKVDPSVVLGLMKRGFTREQALAFAAKATVTPTAQQPSRPAPVTPPAAPTPAKQTPSQQQEPTEFTGRPQGSTHGNPNPPGIENVQGPLAQQAKQHASILSPDDPRVKKQADGKIKGEHFVEGDRFHEQLLNGLPDGKKGRQRQILGQAEQAISDKTPLHVSYLSAPAEAALHPTRESRTVQYEAHSPEARLMGTTEGQLVGHSFIPVSVGITPSKKAGEPHQGVIHGISTNVLANNFHHINSKLAEMGQKTPYKELGSKFTNDLEGYLSNLNAGHTGTGYGHAVGTAEYPNVPNENHVPYHLSRREADFINTAINNTAAFAQHEDGKALRRLAEANGTLLTPEGETNRMRHAIEQHEPGWRKNVLEGTIKSFKAGLIHDVHPSEEHLPATIRPGKEYQALTKAIQRTSQHGRPDVPLSVSPRSQPMASVHRDLAHNQRINTIEREFSEDRINESQAKKLLESIGENPAEYRFVGGSGGLITPYEDDPESLTHEEHTQMKNNLRQQWVGGKLPVDDYRRKVAEIPLPTKPSRKPTTVTSPAPKPLAPTEPETPEETPAKPDLPKAPPAPSDPALPKSGHGEQEEQPEKIRAAATKFSDGSVHEGLTHSQAISNGVRDENDNLLPEALKAYHSGHEHGFVTSSGRFVGRQEAWKISQYNKQISKSPRFPGSLAAEDVVKYAPNPPAPTPKLHPAPDEPLPVKKPAKETTVHTFKEVKPEEFIEHRNKSSKPEFLSDLKPEDIRHHKLFTNQDNTVGAAVSPEGDIQNVFNNGGEKGAGAHAVAHAIEHHGGNTLDAYDGFLPKYYRQFGFKETGRTKFNPEFAPKWDTNKHGTPDVVHMGWSGHPEGGPEAAVERAKNRDESKWIPNERSNHYDDDFDAQKSRSQAYARGAKTDRPYGALGGAETVPAGKTALPGSGLSLGGTVGKPKKPAKSLEQIAAEKEDLRQADIHRKTVTPEQQAARDEIQHAAQQALAANPESDPLSAHHYINGHAELPDWIKTKEHIGKHFDQVNPKLDYAKDEHRQRAADALTHDVLHGLSKNSSAYDWYDDTVDKSLNHIGQVAPKILTHKDHEMAFKLATAITSQGQDVFPNFESGYLGYRHWHKTGQLPEDPSIFGGGTKAQAMVANFKRVNRLWKKLGPEGLREVLDKKMTMRELRDKYGINVPGESPDHEMEGAAMLGPKIGSFYNNLNKRFHSTTFDLWATRNLNRISGSMLKFSPNSLLKDSVGKKGPKPGQLSRLDALLANGTIEGADAKQQKAMRAEAAALRKLKNPTRERVLGAAPTIAEWSDREHNRYAKGTGGRSYPKELKSDSTSLAKNMNLNLTDLADAPRGPKQRQQFRDIYQRTQDNLSKHGIDMSHASNQAVLWFIEQKLFQMGGSRNRASFDYLDASHRLVRKIKSGELPDLHGEEPMQKAA